MAKSKTKQNRSVFKSGTPPVIRDHVAGMVNPFAPEAEGSKIHDANASRTFTYQERCYHTVLCNGNEEGYTMYFPSLANYTGGVDMGTDTHLASGTTGGAATFSYTNSDNYTSIGAAGHKYRIVSWGIRITCLGDAFNTKGRLMIREMEQLDLTTGTVVDSFTDNTVSVPITHDMDITVVPNHVGEEYQKFRDPTTTFNTLDTDVAAQPPYRCVGLYLSGVEAIAANGQQAILSVETVYNLEILPLINTIGARLASLPAPHSNSILEAVHNTRAAAPLAEKTPNIWQKIKGIAGIAVKGLAHQFLGSAGDMVSDFLSRKRVLPQITYQGNSPMLLSN